MSFLVKLTQQGLIYKISEGTNYKNSINTNNVNIGIQDCLINGQ